MSERSLRAIQASLPWSVRYSSDFRSNPQSHKDFAHAILHVHKAGGKLAAIIDDLDHRRGSDEMPRVADYLADLVICALRAANTCPGNVIDLLDAVERRIVVKNPPPDDAAEPVAKDDPFGRFLAECVAVEPGAKCSVLTAYDLWRAWQLVHRERVWSFDAFCRAMVDRGFSKIRTVGGPQVWLDVRLIRTITDVDPSAQFI